MDCSNGAIHWNPLFFRPVQDWEMKAMEYFLDDLYSTKVRQEGHGCCILLSYGILLLDVAFRG